MSNAQTAKKIRQAHRRTAAEITAGVQQSLPQIAARAVLEMRKWGLRDRFKFAWWLLFGRGEWKGV